MNGIITRMKNKAKPDGTYDLMTRLWAVERLLKVYPNFKDLIVDELIVECVDVIKSPTATAEQKRASRIMLNTKFGVNEANNIVEGFAVITDRNDSLVRRWRKKVLERDKECVECGEVRGLQAHHKSRWSDDPVNRINLDNGITLCVKCHAEEHPEIASLIKSKTGIRD